MSTTQTFVQWSQPFTCDNGSSPAVAINENGLCFEMHNGPSGENGMYYRDGQYSANMNAATQAPPIGWTGVNYFGMGAGNQITCGLNNNFAAMAYQDDDKNLYVSWADLSGQQSNGALSWCSPINYTSGENVAMAMASNGRIVAVHQDSFWTNYTMWYATGTAGQVMGGAAQVIQSDNNGTIDGNTIKVAMNSLGNVVVMSSYLEQVTLLAGTWQADNSIAWGTAIGLPDIYVNFDIALDDNNNLLIAAIVQDIDVCHVAWATGTVGNNNVQYGDFNILYYADLSDISVAMNNSGQIYCEASNADGDPTQFQYFVGQAYFNQDYSNWMGQNNSVIGDIPLNLLAIPGTHDSGTFGITLASPVTPDNPDTVLSMFVPEVAVPWAQSQDLNFLQQLNAGIRYFDIRAIYTLVGYYTCHGFLGAAIGQLVNALQTFYGQGQQYSQEVVILDMNHIYTVSPSGVNWGGTSCWMPGGVNGEFPPFCEYINSNLGNMLLPNSCNGLSLNEIYNSAAYTAGGRVILVFDDGYSVQQNSNYWPNEDNASSDYWTTVDYMTMPSDAPATTMNSMWPDTSELANLIPINAGNITNTLLPPWQTWLANGTTPNQFNVLQCIGTENSSIIEAGINPLDYTPDSLQAWEATVCSPYMFYLASDANLSSVNILLVDWLEQTIVTPLCMSINQQKAQLIAATASKSSKSAATAV